MRVIINANLGTSGSGGIQTYLGALISSLGKLKDGSEEYIILTEKENSNWLAPLLGQNQRFEFISPVKQFSRLRIMNLVTNQLKRAFTKLQATQNFRYNHKTFFHLSQQQFARHVSTGLVESLAADVIHFPFQSFFVSSIPSVFNPHDLQHLHYPQFFKPSEIIGREDSYRFACRHATRLAVASSWIASDIFDNYAVPLNKMAVIPWGGAASIQAEPTPPELKIVQDLYNLPPNFIFYPAVAWPHKNHLRLIDALSRLRSRGISPCLVLSGATTSFTPKIQQRIKHQGLEDAVLFLGHVPSEHMRSLYRLARGVVVPTLFEAASGPVAEAWNEGIPVSCSDIPQLREQAQGAAIFFNPFDVDSIASAIVDLCDSEELRTKVIRKGKEFSASLSWEKTALAYRQLYRDVVTLTGGGI